MYAIRLAHGPVDLAFTDRYGGVSAAPYDELNLALPGSTHGDDPASLEENHRRVLADFAPDARLVDLSQVHGADVFEVDRSAGPSRRTDPPHDGPHTRPHIRPAADGVVCAGPDVVLMVRAADCLPVLLADPDAGVVGAAHAGRAGLVAGVVPAVVRRMRELGARHPVAWLGPAVCGGCYEVPETMQAQVGALEPAAVATTTWGTAALDLAAGVRAQLEREGVPVSDLGRCTRESPDLYSHRRDGTSSGRIAGLVRLRAR